MMPVRLILKRQGDGGGKQRLAAMLDRFTCKICHRTPARAWLNETHNRILNHGAPPGWSVQLVLFPAIEAEAAE